MQISDYMHARLGDTSRRLRCGSDIDALRKILAQMGKQGSNLNQLTHHLNSCEGASSTTSCGRCALTISGAGRPSIMRFAPLS
jgi:hypothetical protein